MLEDIWFSVICFVAGALVGVPLWNWLKDKMPWSK